MYDRNQLVHAVIWPKGKTATITMLDAEGVVHSEFAVREPMKGSELSKMIPPGYGVEFDDCTVLSMSGEILVRTVGEFDTAVVTERAQVTAEERLQRLERREMRRERRELEREQENAELRRQLADRETVVDGDDTPPAGDPPADTPPAEISEGGDE